MSQKTNPYSLRLQKTNKCFSSSWYSHYFYKEINSNDLEMRSYVKGIFHQVAHSYEYLCLQNHYKRIVLFLFVVDVREILHERRQALRFLHPMQNFVSKAKLEAKLRFAQKGNPGLPFSKGQENQSIKGESSPKAAKLCEKYGLELAYKNSSKAKFCLSSEQIPPLLFAAKSSAFKEWKQKNKPFVKCLSFKLSLSRKDDCPSNKASLCKQRLALLSKGDLPATKTSLVGFPFHKKPQLAMSPKSSFQNTISLQALVFGKKPFGLDGFGCKSIKVALQTRQNFALRRKATHSCYGYNYLHFHSHFRLSPLISIFSIQALHDFSAVSFLIDEIIYLLHRRFNFRQITDYILQEATKLHFVKGIRLSCSGRFGGRSKKAQKSKTQSIQWGKSSLHVFSSKLSFASKSALTPFGKVGVKLWVSYR